MAKTMTFEEWWDKEGQYCPTQENFYEAAEDGWRAREPELAAAQARIAELKAELKKVHQSIINVARKNIATIPLPPHDPHWLERVKLEERIDEIKKVTGGVEEIDFWALEDRLEKLTRQRDALNPKDAALGEPQR